MSKYVNKTQPTSQSVTEFIKNIPNQSLVEDSLELATFFEKVTGFEPVLWGVIVGYGNYHYINKSSEGDWFLCGFAPRTSTIAIYVNGVVTNKEELYQKLGKFKQTGSCLHIKKLADIDLTVLEEIITAGNADLKTRYKL